MDTHPIEVAQEPGAGTRESLLDAAERLFALHGFDAASLRAITQDAGVNLAAVSYHFGSKDGLLQAVFARRLAPINRRRLALLEACEKAAGADGPAVEQIVRALIAPVLEMAAGDSRGGREFPCLIARALGESGGHARALVLGELQEVKERFVAALERALPWLPRAEIYWRLHYMIGAMVHTAAGGHLLELYSDGLVSAADGNIERLVTFLAAGMRSPVATGQEVSDAR